MSRNFVCKSFVLDVVNKNIFVSKQSPVISPGNGEGFENEVLVLKSQELNVVLHDGKAQTFGPTSSIIACLRLSRLSAFLAGVLATTLSSTSM